MSGPTLVINGTPVDRVADRVTLHSVHPYIRDSVPSFGFSRSGITLTSAVDPYDGQSAALYDPFGNPLVVGFVASNLTHYDQHLGWCREYTCYGYAKQCEYIPVTDSNTLTDTAKFNLPSDDPDYIASRAGRTVGQIILDVLEMPQNKTPLFAAVPGAYTGNGTGATATCTLSAGSIATVVVTNGGSGYLSAPAVRFSGGGGSGASVSAVVSNGVVTGFGAITPGAGYVVAPAVAIVAPPPVVTATGTASVGGGAVTGLVVGAAGSGYVGTSASVTFNNSGTGGSGAAATAVVSNGVVTGLTITAPGSSYATPPLVIIAAPPAASTATATAHVTSGGVSSLTLGSAGSGYVGTTAGVIFTGGATATAHVSAGAVTSITINTAGGGYLSPPIVLISTLSVNTLADLDTLNIIPPFEFDVAGERILSAIEGMIQTCHPNHFLHIDPDGEDIRILDPRTFSTTITLTLGGSDHRVDPATLSVTMDYSQCFSRCILRGNSLVLPYTLDILPYPGSADLDGGLTTDFAHDGLTEAQAIAQWNPADFQEPQQSPGTAVGVAALSGSTVGSISVQYGGSAYSAPPTVSLSGGGGSGATATATLTSGVVTSFTVTAAGTGYTGPPAVLCTGPAVGQSMVGTISTMGSTIEVTLSSADPSSRFPADYWDQTDSGHHGVIVLRQDAVTDFTQYFTAQVVANTAMVPGGTAIFQLATPAPATSYTSFQLFGTSGGANVVWRRYKPSNADIAARMANYFPYPMAYRNSDNTSATLTSTPKCTVFYSPSGSPPYEQLGMGLALDPVAGTVLTVRPTSLVFSGDGVTITPVDNVQVFLPVHVGELFTVWPPDSMGSPVYAGSMFDDLAIERTKTISVNDWRDQSNSANMNLMAHEFFDSFCNIVIEGTITYHGFLADAVNFNRLLTITASYPIPTLWSGIPIISCEVIFNERGGATSYSTVLSFSNRRLPYSGAALARPAVVGQAFGGSFEGSMANTMQGMNEAGMMAANPMMAGQQSGADQNAMGSMSAARSMAGSGGPLDLSGPKIAPGFGGGGDLGIPQGLGDLGVPTNMSQMGLPQGPGDLGIATNPMQSLAMRGADPFGGQNSAFNQMMNPPQPQQDAPMEAPRNQGGFDADGLLKMNEPEPGPAPAPAPAEN